MEGSMDAVPADGDTWGGGSCALEAEVVGGSILCSATCVVWLGAAGGAIRTSTARVNRRSDGTR